MAEKLNERITTAGILQKGNLYFVSQREDKGSIGGFWEFPGGKNRWGESVEQTLIREFKEELHLDITVGELVHSHDFENKGTLYHLKAHLVSCSQEQEPALSVHTSWRWATLEELTTLSFAPSDQKIVESLRLGH